MTELQVKTKKGSLKKFLAMFLAFCVCLTTVFVDGAFAQAEGNEGNNNSFTANVAVTAGNATKVNVTVGTGEDATGDDAAKETGWYAEGETHGIAITGTKNEINVDAKNATAGGPYNISVKFIEKITSGDSSKVSVYKGVLTVQVNKADSGEEENPDPDVSPDAATPDAAFRSSSYTLGRGANDKVDLSTEVSPSNAKKTGWTSSNNAKITVSNAGVVTLTAAGKADKNAISATIAVTANGKSISCTVNVAADSTTQPPVVNPKDDSVASVTVSPKTLSLKVAETGKVAATVALASDKDTTITKKAAKTVTWKSSNDKVATVDKDGNVKAVAAGTATITATSTADTKKADTCAVTVTEDKKDDKPVDTTVAVTSLTLNAKTVYLKTGAKLTVKAVVAPSNATDKKVTWTSNKKNIASVDSKGVIKAGKKTGKATITAKAGSKTAKVTVNVVKKAKKTTSVKLSKTKVTLKAKEQIALSATLSKGATSKVKWTTSDKKVAAVKDGVVTAKKKGTAVVTATADGKSADCVITVTDAAGKKATALKANTKKISVKVKKTKKIKVSPKKGDKVKSYVSSNKKIATVSKKGVVTGKKKGKATIVVTTKKGAVATIPVTVK